MANGCAASTATSACRLEHQSATSNLQLNACRGDASGLSTTSELPTLNAHRRSSTCAANTCFLPRPIGNLLNILSAQEYHRPRTHAVGLDDVKGDSTRPGWPGGGRKRAQARSRARSCERLPRFKRCGAALAWLTTKRTGKLLKPWSIRVTFARRARASARVACALVSSAELRRPRATWRRAAGERASPTTRCGSGGFRRPSTCKRETAMPEHCRACTCARETPS